MVTRAALSEFHRSVHQAIGPRALDEFQRLSEKSDRLGMMKILMEADPVKKLRIGVSFAGKNDKEARRIYEKYRSIRKDGGGERVVILRVSFLTKALFAASPETPLFREIILERAECWLSLGAFARCARDCDFLASVLDDRVASPESNESPSRIEALKQKLSEIRSRCSEASKRSRKSGKGSNKCSGIGNSPEVDGRASKKLLSCGDSVVASFDEKRGRHLVATRNIKVGSVIMIDRPFSFSTDVRALGTNCLHCHVSLNHDDRVRVPCNGCQTVAYCSVECRRASWLSYHRFECEILDYFYETDEQDVELARERRSRILLAWRTTIASAIEINTRAERDAFGVAKNFLALQEAPSNEEKKERVKDLAIEPYDPVDYRTVYALETHCSDATALANFSRCLNAIFLAKCLDLVLTMRNRSTSGLGTLELELVAVGFLRHLQAVDCNAYEIVENARNETTKIWEPRNIGGAIYTSVSLVNHACYPNVVRHSYPGGKVVVRAIRSIRKGSEILDCYGPHFVSDSIDSRKKYLREKYYFECACEACSNDYCLPDGTVTTFKCPHCAASVSQESKKCRGCERSIDVKKLEAQLAKSSRKRGIAVAKMYDGNYAEGLPILIEHAILIDKILAEPSLEAIKTQQSIIQCYNSFSSIFPSVH